MLEERTAGDPDDQRVKFTEMTPPQISAAVTAMGTPVSPAIVRNWLEGEGLALHKIEKNLAGGESPDRDAQFCHIAGLKRIYLNAGNPVFSIDKHWPVSNL